MVSPSNTARNLSDDADWLAAPGDEKNQGNYHLTDLDDSDWISIATPGHWRSCPALADSDGPVLYRTRFSNDDHDHDRDRKRRSWLVFDGIFYSSDIWLDGTYLGDTEGYFFPHTFEITDQIADRTEHVLALEVACAPQVDRKRKRNLTGVFQHWDMTDPTWNPGGIWRDVRIEQSGPVRIRHMRVLCREANEQSATVFIRAVLDTVEATTVHLRTTVIPTEGDGPEVQSVSEHAIAAGENRLEWTVTVNEPALWWPTALGDQPLYDVIVEVLEDNWHLSDRRVRRTGLRQIQLRNWICSVNGERMFLKGSNLGPTKIALSEATPAEIKADVDLAVTAGLDLVRVFGHIARQEFYDAADAAGLLIWQDLPLQWGYARSVRRQARRQAREAVDLLGHHPAIAIWCGHNEPFTVDIGPGVLGEPGMQKTISRKLARKTLLPTWNKSILDHSVRSVLDHTDGTRPAIAHSGVLPHPPTLDGTDSHLWLGWYHRCDRDLQRLAKLWPRLMRFVGEFGAQAIPTDATFLEPHLWPNLDWERASKIHGLQIEVLDRHIPRGEHKTFESWRDATQHYQAELIRHHILTLRRLKYRPCGGFTQHCFTDSSAAISWSVLDHLRNPKEGFAALQDACRPVVVVADRLPSRTRCGRSLGIDIHVVSDLRNDLRNLICEARIETVGSSGTVKVGKWQWKGDVGADTCVRVGRIELTMPDPGDDHESRLDLVVTLHQAGAVKPLASYRDHTVIQGEVGPR